MSLATTSFINNQAVAQRSSFTHVGFLIDSSGSMSPYTRAVEEGVNNLYKTVCELGKGNLFVSEFSGSYYPIIDKPFAEVCQEPRYRFSSRDSTCLYKSILEIIKDVEAKLEQNNKKQNNKKKRVIVPILTDGQDTGCGTTEDAVKKVIQQKTKEGWQFVLLGADVDASNIAQEIGISEKLAVTFALGNMQQAIEFVGDKIKQVSKGKKVEITSDERKLLEGNGVSSNNRRTEF